MKGVQHYGLMQVRLAIHLPVIPKIGKSALNGGKVHRTVIKAYAYASGEINIL
jgi:hypothetical protein